MTEISDYTTATALRAFFPGRTIRQTARAFALEAFLLDWAETGAVTVFKGPGPDPTTLAGYASDKLWLRTNTGVNPTSGSVRIWNGSAPASSEANWVALTKARFLDYLGVSISGADLAIYATRAAAGAATIDAGKTFLLVNGFASLQDGGEGLYRKLGSTPSPVKLWQFQSADGAYWELVPDEGQINVRQLGATGDGVTNDLTAIQAAVDYWAPFTTPAASGGIVLCPPGTYLVNASIVMTGCHGLKIKGAGPLATEVKASGDFPVFFHLGSSGAPLNKGAISGMTIRGGGKSNASAHGISWTWCNGCEITDVVLYACRHGLNLYHQWQTTLDDIDSHGGASDKCYTGVYLGESTVGSVDNSVIANALNMKDCEQYGYRIVNGQGSKWSNCEAGACTIGWHIGDVPPGAPPCQWMHFSNCLGDSCSQYNWFLTPGSGVYVGYMSFVGQWSGNAGIHGMAINGAKFISISGGEMPGNAQAAIYVVASQLCAFGGIAMSGNNASATAGVYDITLSNSTYISVNGNVCESSTGTANFGEVGASDNNVIVGNIFPNGGVVVGSLDKVSDNLGMDAKRNGSAVIANGTSSIVVTHGLEVTPTIDDIVLQPRSSLDAVGLKDIWASAITATQFTINANTNATGGITIAWQVHGK